MKDEGSFQAGLMHGQWRGWFPNGKPSYAGNRTRDMQEGAWTFFHSSGFVSEEGHFSIIKRKDALGESYGNSKDGYEQSVKSGLWIMYSQKDHKKSGEGSYKEGKMHGAWTYYHPGGVVPAVTTNYKDGKQHGTTTEFTQRGKKKMEINYKNNLKDGNLIVYDKNGRVVHHQVYKEGRLVKDELKKTKYKYKK
jgi:antitoxin component YwqK of YwqJK toxin-antitoxin module